jgi:hypothetical protein
MNCAQSLSAWSRAGRIGSSSIGYAHRRRHGPVTMRGARQRVSQSPVDILGLRSTTGLSSGQRKLSALRIRSFRGSTDVLTAALACDDCLVRRATRFKIRIVRHMNIKERLRQSLWPGRIALTFVGLSLVLTGAAALRTGRLHYQNYWGGSVFAPLAIVVGITALVVVIVRWRSLNETGPRLRGKAVRRQRRAAERRSAVETFDKPWNP